MNGNDKLRAELSRRSDTMADAQLDFDAMRGQARGIRRRRRIGTGIAAAAVLAVITVPAALVLDNGNDDSAPGPAEGTTQVPDRGDRTPKSPDSTPDPSLADDAVAAKKALEQLPTSSGLDAEYLYDDTVHLRDGNTVQVPKTKLGTTGIASYHGGWMIAETTANGDPVVDATIRQYDRSGDEVTNDLGTHTFAVSNDGTQLAWWTWDPEAQQGELHSAGASGMGEGDGATSSTGDATYVLPIGYLPSGELVYGATVEGVGQTTKATDFAGNVRDIDTLMSVASTDQLGNRIAGQSADDEKQARVVDGSTGEEVWHKDGWMLGRFSPDGEHVIGFRIGADPLEIAILDAADGSVVSQVDLLGHFGLGYDEVVWNNDTSLAIEAYVFDGTSSSEHVGALLRFDVDGKLTRATDVSDAYEGWVFLPRP